MKTYKKYRLSRHFLLLFLPLIPIIPNPPVIFRIFSHSSSSSYSLYRIIRSLATNLFCLSWNMTSVCKDFLPIYYCFTFLGEQEAEYFTPRCVPYLYIPLHDIRYKYDENRDKGEKSRQEKNGKTHKAHTKLIFRNVVDLLSRIIRKDKSGFS